jgi:hypothetical protein
MTLQLACQGQKYLTITKEIHVSTWMHNQHSSQRNKTYNKSLQKRSNSPTQNEIWTGHNPVAGFCEHDEPTGFIIPWTSYMVE